MKATVITEIDITSPELAEAFANACSDEQAKFLNNVGRAFAGWSHKYDEEGQFWYIVKDIDSYGKRLLFALANCLKSRHLDGEKWQTAMRSWPEIDKEDLA